VKEAKEGERLSETELLFYISKQHCTHHHLTNLIKQVFRQSGKFQKSVVFSHITTGDISFPCIGMLNCSSFTFVLHSTYAVLKPHWAELL